MTFLTHVVALYLYKSTIWPGSPSYNLDMLDKLQKWVYGTVGLTLAASLEPLTFRQNVASLSLFYRHCFVSRSSELPGLVPLPYSRGRSTRCFDRLHDFSVTIRRCYKDVYFSSFFPHIARL